MRELGAALFGKHVTLAYSSDDEIRGLLTDFAQRAVTAGHRVVVFLDTESGDLARAVAKGVTGAAPGQFTTVRFDTGQTGAPLDAFGGPIFGVADMLDLLTRLADDTLGGGWPAVAVAGQMTWTDRPAWTPTDLFAYEHEVNRFFGDPRVTGLCLYDRRRFGKELLARIGAVHPGPLLAFTLGGWGAHLRLTGELDASNAESLPSILELVAGADSVVMLDASDLDFVDAAGAGHIVRFAASRPHRHTVVRCGRAVRQALQLVGAESVPSLVLRDRVPAVSVSPAS
ncbi:MEDS domain-containing protein [Dactylosporangium sp. NPDC049140]|uniref:MEDS domain-containing protein n=1 Tax=Dactylosporangium sp. NPDC049140 TaxID=3155647 RepID=UPI0034020869